MVFWRRWGARPDKAAPGQARADGWPAHRAGAGRV